MDVTTVLVVAILINKSCSQILSLSPTCFSNGDTLTLKCETSNVNQGITFYHDGTSQGGCVPSVPVTCGPGITQSGTTTSLIISSFNDAANSGNWTCEYGLSSTPDIIITVNPCLETSTNFESSSVIESTSTSIFIESNAGISPTDVSQLNTLNIFSFSSAAENFSTSNFTSDRKQTSASFQTENFETIDTTNALFFMNTTSLIPNTVLSSMSLIQNFDSYKTSIQSSMIETVTISPLTVTIESDYQSTSSYFDAVSLFSETTIGLLTSGVYMTTPEISPGLIYSALDSSFSPTTEVCPTNTFTETVSSYMTSTETISAGMTSTETVSTGMTSTETVSTGMTSTETLSTGMTSSYKMFDIVSEGNETTSITSITDANVLTRYSLSDDIPVLQTTFDSFTTSWSPIHQSVESLITSTVMSNFFTSISEEAGFSSSFTLEAPRSTNTVLTADEYESQTSKLVYKNTSDSQFTLSNYELSDTSRTIIFEKGDFSTTPLSYSSVIDTVKHTSYFVMTSSFNEQSVSVTHNSFISSLTIKTLIQTSSLRNNEAESSYTERDSYLPTKLFSSMPDEITETVSSTYDDEFILLTSTEHILLVTSSLNTLGSFTSGIENSVLTTESFVKMISRSSIELATSSSSLDTFSPKYVKTTTAIQHGLSESSKDDIFISAVSGTIGAIILVFLIAMVVSRYFMKRNTFKDEKDDEISNQLGWSDDGGMNSYNKNYTSREYIFNSGSIHLPLKSYESPYFPYANNYKKNWDDNT